MIFKFYWKYQIQLTGWNFSHVLHIHQIYRWSTVTGSSFPSGYSSQVKTRGNKDRRRPSRNSPHLSSTYSKIVESALVLTCFVKWGDQKVFQTNFSHTKAYAHSQALSNGAFSKSIAPMVRELQVSNKQNNNNKKKKTKWAVLAVSVLNVQTIPK